MKYYTDTDCFYALDDDGNLFRTGKGRGFSWSKFDESSALEAVVVLGPGAFPPKVKVSSLKRYLGKVFGYIIVNPIRAFRLACSDNSDFIMGTCVITFAAVFLGFLIWGLCHELGRGTQTSGTPTAVIVQYGDTSVSYPLQNTAPKVVKVRE